MAGDIDPTGGRKNALDAFLESKVQEGFARTALWRRCFPLAAEHSVAVPTSLTARIDALTSDVKSLRDWFIVHPHGPRGHLIRRIANVEDNGEVRLKIKWASDADVEPVFSTDLSALDAAMRDYVREVVALIEMRPLG